VAEPHKGETDRRSPGGNVTCGSKFAFCRRGAIIPK